MNPPPVLDAPDRPAARPALAGSSDAWSIVGLARAGGDVRRAPLAVICASSLDAQRLVAELRFFASELRVALFPDWETLPYDSFSPHQDLVSERLETLYRLMRGDLDIVVCPATTALYRLAPDSYLAAYTFFLKQGETLSIDRFREQLTRAGYSHVSQVVSPGEYCIRGSLIDLFPMGSSLPYRIDLLDNDIESIRTFDADTQRTLFKVPEIRLLPAREFPLDDSNRTRFRARFRDTFEGDATKAMVYRDVSSGIATAGLEYYLPLFFDETGTLFDYLPAGSTLVLHGDCAGTIDSFWKEVNSRFTMLKGDRTRPLMAPPSLFLTAEQFYIEAREFERVDLRGIAATDPALANIAVERKADDPLTKLKAYLASKPPPVLILAEAAGRRETIREYFGDYDLRPTAVGSFAEFLAAKEPVMLGVGPVLAGFVTDDFAIITESELYPATARSRGTRDAGKRSSIEGMVRDLAELRVGDPVVHIEHGVGRYRGLINLDLGEAKSDEEPTTELLVLEYAGGDKLYVPVAQLHVIARYAGGPPEQAPLHKLGSGDWDKAKKKAAKQVRDTAAELLAIYAQRAARQGHAFKVKAHDLDAFAEGFGFEETPDQAGAIEAVISDMLEGKPMDRLICGDVGFGKTEVALRAAFVAIADGKQVAVLTPTTLLAEQHFQTFSNRFADFPVKIAELSRFRSSKEIAAAMEGIAEGRIDLVIGTHKLLQPDVKFKRLGLVIIDEEHRFGVRQKESLKALRAEVDALTLTATPIPRTLAMSLEGLRDLSVIATAPSKRLAIKTFVMSYSHGIIREAVMRELKRGGQIYFLHNDVATIELARERLTELVPEARIAVAHGQMGERDLERVMREFLSGRANLLLCSTIIETGIDIASANTIIIDRADKFGLAQLHQLRGRVGRSHHQAYAYLLTPPHEALSANAKKRLEAIQMMEELGSGFYLAMHDLEIRGAGEVLGDNQSGEIQEIGFNLFTDMLNHAIKSLQSGREPDLSAPLGVTTEINLHFPALLPPTYCSDVHERLVLYKRLANCEDEASLVVMQEELIDRFGLLPDGAEGLLSCHRMRIAARPIGITKVDASDRAVTLQFEPTPAVDSQTIIGLVQNNRHWKLAGPAKLRIEIASSTLPERVQVVRGVIAQLMQKPLPAAVATPATTKKR